jgi:hypothetical protein
VTDQRSSLHLNLSDNNVCTLCSASALHYQLLTSRTIAADGNIPFLSSVRLPICVRPSVFVCYATDHPMVLIYVNRDTSTIELNPAKSGRGVAKAVFFVFGVLVFLATVQR